MRIERPALTDMEIRDGYEIRYKDHVYVADEVPDDNGHACGHDEAGRDCDLWFVWSIGCWVFVNAELAEQEIEAQRQSPEERDRLIEMSHSDADPGL
jgi:hypothetical protein